MTTATTEVAAEAKTAGAAAIVRVLTVAGIVEIAVGLLHFVMPGLYRQAPGLANLSNIEDDFVTLMTFAVGILLVAFGAFTMILAGRNPQDLGLLQYYLAVKCGLWAARLLLETLYPVQLKMFGIDPFTMIVLPGVAVELLLFVYASYRVWTLRQLSETEL